MSSTKVQRTGNKPRPAYGYKAHHKRATKLADDCHQGITDAEKKDEIERYCDSCGVTGKFKFEKEVAPSQD